MLYKTTRLIEFHYTDQAGIAHFSTFFLLMESAEHEFLRSIGTSVSIDEGDGKISFPRIAASAEYLAPARFEDVLEIEVTLERLGTKSLTYGFRFSRQGQLIARGKLTAACCRIQPGKPLKSIPIPDSIAAKIASAEGTDDAQAQPSAQGL